MSRALVVVGAGVAGTAAAWALRRGGDRVTVVDGGLGASGMGGGAVDDVPWDELAVAERRTGKSADCARISAEMTEFVEALGLHRVAAEGPRAVVATIAGRLRSARGHDRALLDLSRFTGQTVGVLGADRAGWDADALARGLQEEAFAREKRLDFRAVDGVVFRHALEDRYPDADLAALVDEPARFAWLAERLAEVIAENAGKSRLSALLVGPWLGLAEPRAEALSERLGVAVGEVLVASSPVAGLRFEAARARLFAANGVILRRARAMELRPDGKLYRVVLEGGEELEAEAVALALGGVAGGGVLYTPPERRAGAGLPTRGGVPFALSMKAPFELAIDARALDVMGSMMGPDLDERAWSVLERVGVAANSRQKGLIAVGDLLSGRPRTWLAAAQSGLSAKSAF